MIKSRLFKYHINGTLVCQFPFCQAKIDCKKIMVCMILVILLWRYFQAFFQTNAILFYSFCAKMFKFVFMANHKMQFYFCRPPVNGGNYNDNFERVEWSCSYFLWRLTFWYFRRITRYENNLSKINCLATLHTRFLLGFRSIPSYLWHCASTSISDTRTQCIAGRNNALCDHAKDH